MDNVHSLRNTLSVLLMLCSLLGWHSQSFAAEAAQPQQSQATASVNINSASASEIAAALNGVGEKRAEAIVAYREANGPFKSLDDLQQVKGIGEKVLEKNAGKIVF